MQCARCKERLTIIKDFVYKSSKNKMTHIGVCPKCYEKSRTLKVPKLGGK
jgi:hydrogenase maturation factor HypF (carbamoyltransferase family)